MQYMLLIYGDQDGWKSRSEEENGQIMQAYMQFTEELQNSGSMVAGDALQPTADRDHGSRPQRRDAHHRRPVRGDEGAARRLLHRRRRLDRRGARVGGEDPRRQPRLRRGAAGDGLRGGRLVVLDERLPGGVGAHPRDPRPRARRRRARRGRGAGGLRRRARALAARGRPRQPGRVAADDGAQPRDRPDPARAEPAPQDRAAGGARDAAEPTWTGGRDPRRAAEPDLRLLPPGARDRGAGGADAAHARRPDHRGDRARVPRPRADDGAAARAGEEEDPRGRDPVPRPARPPAAGAAALGARGRLPDLQRGLRAAAARASCARRRSGSARCSRC